MKKWVKRISILLVVCLTVTMVAPYTTNAATKTTLDPEVQRGITLGLVSKSYLKTPKKYATTKEAKSLFATLMKKKGASAAKIKKWNKVATGSGKKTMTVSDLMMGTYYVACYLTPGGIPKGNAYDNGAAQADSGKVGDIATLVKYKNDKKNLFKFYNLDGHHEGTDPLVTNEHNSVIAYGYSPELASYYSGQYVIPIDYSKNKVRLNQKLTREQLVLSLVRFYDSFEPTAKFITMEQLGAKIVISAKDIKNAKAVPDVDQTGISNEYIGTYIQNYGGVGADGSLQVLDNPTYNYRESDFKAMADLGINYVRLQMAINSFAYPKYSKDRSKVNEVIVKDVDNAIRWGVKYGLHVSICFSSYLDDDIDGLGAMYPDGTKENEFTPDYLATVEQYQLKGELLHAFAKRYKNVPAKNLSFELQNENAAQGTTSEGVREGMLTDDEMADQFIMLAKRIWEVTPERSVSLSTDQPLNENILPYWSKIAAAGINLDYHCYEPRQFVAPDQGRHVDLEDMIWPNFKDSDGEIWDMEKVYQVYIKPWQELADQYGVNLKLGECGIFVDMNLFASAPYQQKYVVAWAKDFAKTMQSHKVSYAIGKVVGNCSVTATVKDFTPAKDNHNAYIRNAKYIKKTYKTDDYSITYYINKELANACYLKQTK